MSVVKAKIPDMFTRALKRKGAAILATSAVENAQDVVVKKKAVLVESKVETTDVESNVNSENVAEPMSVTTTVAEAEKCIAVKSGANFATTVEDTLMTTVETKRAEVKEDATLLSLLTDGRWRSVLEAEFQKTYMRNIDAKLQNEYKQKKIFPPRHEIFSAFNLTPFDKLKVVVIGQDPYHNDGQAHGLSFSVKRGIKQPPSLKNMFKELTTDINGFKTPDHGNLAGWAEQGVFMLNATLTVEAHQANSHAKLGWQTFTDKVIQTISKEHPRCIFLLWGGFAHKKETLIDTKRHFVIKTAHPSPLSARKWFGCKCFSATNSKLEEWGLEPINWSHLP